MFCEGSLRIVDHNGRVAASKVLSASPLNLVWQAFADKVASGKPYSR